MDLAGQQGNYPFGESWYAASTTLRKRFATPYAPTAGSAALGYAAGYLWSCHTPENTCAGAAPFGFQGCGLRLSFLFSFRFGSSPMASIRLSPSSPFFSNA